MKSRATKFPLWLAGALLSAQVAGCTIGQSVLAPLHEGGAGDTSADSSADAAAEAAAPDGTIADTGAPDADTDADTDAGAADAGADAGGEMDAGADSGGDMDAGPDSGGGMDAGGMDADNADAAAAVDAAADAARDAAADAADVAPDTSCPTGQMRCGATCVDTTTSTTNCGMCGRTCAGGANATASCTMGVCGLTCAAGFANCDMNAANGCEVNLSAPGSCGRCGNNCPVPPNATATCSMATCGFTCLAGFANCDGNAGNGCEVDMATDRFHCGRCGNMCPVGAACRGSVCLCSLGTTVCSGVCVDLTADTNNCGACGRVCPMGQVCGGGVCRPTCASGFTLCGTTCVRLGDDPNNCGMCGRRCAGSETCAGGVCVPVMSIDPIGCADGARDAFTNRATFPNIAACSGAWQLAGIFPSIPKSLLPACTTLGDDSMMAPANGAGCASSNLCAPGWHICNGGEIATRTGGTGCTATTDYPAGSFYAASVSGTGCNVCALRTGTVTGATCTSSSCTANCRESGDLNNDFFGCGVIGSAITPAGCDGLNRASGDNCGSLGAPWVCGGSVMESRTVTKTGAAAGGVLCCRD